MEGGGADGVRNGLQITKMQGLRGKEFSGDWGDQRWLPGGGRGREE